MSACPNCHGWLIEGRDAHGLFWLCPACGGYALTLVLLRKQLPAEALNEIWRATQEHRGSLSRACPLCGRRMREVPSTVGILPIQVDVCSLCTLIWFDPGEYRTLLALA